MLTLVTGGTGTVGAAVVRRLVDEGRAVRALVRDPVRAGELLPRGVELVTGDVTDEGSVRRAMAGCDRVFHTAGLPEQWLPDERVFDQVNARGSESVAEAGLEVGVESFVYTSTIDVFAWVRGQPFDEGELASAAKGSAYERSKQAADRAVVAAAARGLPVRFVHPSAVYGPAPVVNPGLNDVLRRLATGRIPMLLPGGIPVVYVDDVARGHLLAERAPAGERFILHESFATLTELARLAVNGAGHGRVPPVLPIAVARAVCALGEGMARITRRPPLIASGELQFLLEDVHPIADKARRRLGWSPTPVAEGVERTIAWLRERDLA